MEQQLKAEGDRFREEIFTAAEIACCENKQHPAQHYAARFAAKEALLKALIDDDRGGFFWKEAEILNDPDGKPRLHLHNRLKEVADKMGVKQIHLSISHTKTMTMAVVILEG